MELRISLSPTGGLRLHIPDAKRTLDIPVEYAERVECPCCGETSTVPVTTAALRTIKRLLRNADEYRGEPARGHIGAFPTQAVLESWMRADAQRKIEDEKAKWAAKGVDVNELKFEL
jgi:hypothetical protein